MPSIVNPIAALGFEGESGKGNNDFYDQNRPSYPKAALEGIYSEVTKGGKKKEALKLIELGSGTGIFTRLLVQPPKDYPQFNVKQLTAIEPVKGMRESFTRNLPKTSIDVSCVNGTFTEFPAEVADGQADAVVIAQAFHWAHPHYEEAITAINKSLAPDGSLILIWNMEDETSSSWVRSLRSVYQAHESGSPQYRLHLWHALFSTPTYTANFSPPEHTHYTYTNPATIDLVINRALSKSYTSVLPAEEKEALEKKMRAVLEEAREKGDLVVGEDGGIQYPYRTEVVVCRRK